MSFAHESIRSGLICTRPVVHSVNGTTVASWIVGKWHCSVVIGTPIHPQSLSLVSGEVFSVKLVNETIEPPFGPPGLILKKCTQWVWFPSVILRRPGDSQTTPWPPKFGPKSLRNSQVFRWFDPWKWTLSLTANITTMTHPPAVFVFHTFGSPKSTIPGLGIRRLLAYFVKSTPPLRLYAPYLRVHSMSMD